MASFFYDNTKEGTTLKDGPLEALYKRDSQNDYKVAMIRKIAKTYGSPGQFFEDKAIALEKANENAAVIYRNEFKKLVANMLPAAVATVRAKRMADAYMVAMTADIEEDFPSDLNKLNLQLTYNQGTAASSGFAQPDTTITKKPRKPKAKK